MKMIKNTGLLMVAFSFLLAACSESFLDRNPKDQLSESTFWKTRQDAEMALTGAYGRLQVPHIGAQASGWPPPSLPHWDAMTDNAYTQHDYGFRSASIGQIEPISGGVISDVYYSCYKGISACNIFLEKVDEIEGLDAGLVNQWKGEARFLRAFWYYYLTELYGDVPLVLQTQTLENAYIPKSSKTAILAEMLNDLNFAIEHLSDGPFSGRVVKGSALALKTRVLLFNEQYTEAAATAEELVKGSQFSLAEEYEGLFLEPGQANNPEILFSIGFVNQPGERHYVDLVYGWWNAVLPIQDFVDEFEMTDGKSIEESPLYDPDNPYDNRDPRLDYIVRVPGEPWPVGVNEAGRDYWDASLSQTSYSLDKWVDPAKNTIAAMNESGTDIVHLRLADVLLMYAEAKNEVEGPGAEVYEAVNRVRTRPSVDMPPLPEGLSKEEMRNRIRHERRIELAFEGIYYFDLKRWKTAHIEIPKIIDTGTQQPRNFEMKHYLWPLPQSEVDIND
ncbi:RagB/SusD family nutrient uptake outer membrane protein [Rapidithrix thailandica]|uniref:RagB/SusD family nutrient uptake outer membrane protein n=1 Tax=Rapidithrix thailandica TaxID=413964 RepID=A0AAW9S7T1_9BACT